MTLKFAQKDIIWVGAPAQFVLLVNIKKLLGTLLTVRHVGLVEQLSIQDLLTLLCVVCKPNKTWPNPTLTQPKSIPPDPNFNPPNPKSHDLYHPAATLTAYSPTYYTAFVVFPNNKSYGMCIGVWWWSKCLNDWDTSKIKKDSMCCTNTFNKCCP